MSLQAPAPGTEATLALAKHPGLFATLTPVNAEACRAFSDTVDASLTEEDRFKHHRSFMDVGPKPVPISCILESRGLAPEDSDGSTDSEDEKPNRKESDTVWEGMFCLAYKNAPGKPQTGWVLGKGSWEGSNSNNGNVDLLLGWKPDKVRSSHASIRFCHETGILQIRAHHMKSAILVNERPVTLTSGPQALNGVSTTLRIGHLAYQFDFVQYNIPLCYEVEQAKQDFFHTVLLPAENPIRQTFATPAVNDMTVGSWVLHEPMGAGAAGIISAASRRNGPFQVVAIKDMVRYNTQTRHIANRELEAAQLVAKATAGHKWSTHLSVLIDVLYTSGNPSSKIADHMFLLFSPLCRGDLGTHVLSSKVDPPSPAAALDMFTQILRGLSALHDCAIVHRDIKPANIGIRSLVPPHVVLIDFGSAAVVGLQGFKPKPGTCGTITYLAPEMERARYSWPVDIYAAGLVGHQLLLGSHPLMTRGKSLWRADKNTPEELERNKEKHERMMERLEDEDTGAIGDLLASLLMWEPQSRIEAREAVQHRALTSGNQSLEQNGSMMLRRTQTRSVARGAFNPPVAVKPDEKRGAKRGRETETSNAPKAPALQSAIMTPEDRANKKAKGG